MSTKKKTSVALFVVVAFLAGVFFTTAGANVFDLGAETAQTSRAAGTTKLSTAPADFQTAFTKVAESVNPTVVQVQAAKEAQQRRMNPLRRFFGSPRGEDDQQPLRQGIGSGVVVRSNGYIVTNNHVVEDAEDITISTYSGNQYDAEVVGTDPASDLAVVKVDAQNMPTISYGNSDNVQVGQWTMAFGSPLSEDLENTVTAGIVSAKGRVSEYTQNLNAIAEFIQTDAAINPGNSGGPLVNMQGQLIGINAAIASAGRMSRGNVGIAFAIPVNLVESIAQQLIETGSVARAFLGVGYNNVSPALAEDLGVPRGAAQVTRVEPGSAASEAGLEAGDVITSVNGQPLSSSFQLRTTIGSKQPGEEVDLTVVNSQSGEERTLSVELGEQQQDLASAGGPDSQNPGRSPQGGTPDEQQMENLGLSLRSVTPRVLQELGLDRSEEYRGAIIANVDPRSYAYQEAELRKRQIITHVGGQRVRNVKEFAAAVEQVEAGSTFRVRVLVPARGPGNQTQVLSNVTALQKPAN